MISLAEMRKFPLHYIILITEVDDETSQLGPVYLCLQLTFVHRGFTSTHWKDLIDKSVECRKRLHFRQMTLFVVFFGFILVPDTWPMIE